MADPSYMSVAVHSTCDSEQRATALRTAVLNACCCLNSSNTSRSRPDSLAFVSCAAAATHHAPRAIHAVLAGSSSSCSPTCKHTQSELMRAGLRAFACMHLLQRLLAHAAAGAQHAQPGLPWSQPRPLTGVLRYCRACYCRGSEVRSLLLLVTCFKPVLGS
jgi:hypothetical protein